MKHTPLYSQHMRDASVVINLKGFARAMEYCGHLKEHRATREAVTLCDVSHMGEIDFSGPDAEALVQKLIASDASRLAVDQALYSVMCDEKGAVIDDLVCFRLAADHFIWVVNVTKTDQDYQWILKHAAGMKVAVRNVSTDFALMALQGPESREALQRITKADLSTLKYYWLTQTAVHTAQGEVPCVISRTGYTGERGYEILVVRDLAPAVWDELLLVGRPLGIMPHGVAARESLRTEAGYLLNGNDMDGTTNPFEAGLGWVVKFSKDFVGRTALEDLKKNGVKRAVVGLEVQGANTIRKGHRLFRSGAQIGEVTSGPLISPASGRSLGLGYVQVEYAKAGTELEVEIRDRRYPARVVALPLAPRRVREEPSIRTYSPYDLRFTPSHIWARSERDGAVTVGISDFGQRMLGDILHIENPRAGDRINAGATGAWIDSYRKTFEILAPLSGEVIEVDSETARTPARINAYPYSTSGIFRMRASNPREYESLMPFADYAELTAKLSRYDQWSQEKRIF
jgi:glycine cleavage system T protein (aminomethyltransferase)